MPGKSNEILPVETPVQPHSLVLENRHSLTVTGCDTDHQL